MTFHDRNKIKAQVCPECVAGSGEPCRTHTGNRTRLHLLRINRAKRGAAPGPCPSCGERLYRTPSLVLHVDTNGFDCETRP